MAIRPASAANEGSSTVPERPEPAVPEDTRSPARAHDAPLASCSGGGGAPSRQPPMLGRRQLAAGLLQVAVGGAAVASGAIGWPLAPAAPALAASAPPRPLPLPACSAPLDGEVAAAFTRSVVAAMTSLGVMEEVEFQEEVFKLRQREYRYYAEANGLPRVPDLSDGTGGLSNPAYFNFLQYTLWKVLYRHVTDPAQREAAARSAAGHLLGYLSALPRASGALAELVGDPARVAAPAPAAPLLPPREAVLRAVLPLLQTLQQAGYLCDYQVVLGEHPGTWPQDWMLSQPTILDDLAPDPSTTAPSTSSSLAPAPVSSGPASTSSSTPTSASTSTPRVPPGEFVFQLKLHRPADLRAGVALRSEEGAAWPHQVSACLGLLLQRLGYEYAGSFEAPVEAQQLLALASAPSTSAAATPGVGAASSSVGVIGGGGGGVEEGRGQALSDEFVYQDAWEGPKGWGSQLLLLLGDPLEQVGVDFAPSSLVQNWTLRTLATDAPASPHIPSPSAPAAKPGSPFAAGGVAPHPGLRKQPINPDAFESGIGSGPNYDNVYLEAISPTHLQPERVYQKVGFHSIQGVRWLFDKATGYGPDMTESKWLARMIFLETVAGVPGMVAGMLRHLRSLRTMQRDQGWIHTLLEEAENERMHLLTFFQLRQPGLLFRGAVIAAQAVFFNAYLLAYVLSPRTCHAFVGFLEEEAVKTYTHALEEIDAGRLWKDRPAPPIAVQYWGLKKDATMRDLILAVRADEACHAHVNHTLSKLRKDDVNPFAAGASQLP
ncbi:hypothetical protein HYH03_002924 [Edaphochlamys debaryana]|uniref:Ubiquinol oxidase n=1 Tax=Edaphochlamys debaryana TaxID=47281 RepID=A0A835YCT6_9CHLO|nr:hypothetical protein HYH03_002924 [Edaphochlamys debaryana]|eukprot:KAG2499349.1 hypothetical protein HYH03_002924 [Edaphochlamys debaryana]